MCQALSWYHFLTHTSVRPAARATVTLKCTHAHSRVCSVPGLALPHSHTLIKAWAHSHRSMHTHSRKHARTHIYMSRHTQKYAHTHTRRSMDTCTHLHEQAHTQFAYSHSCIFTISTSTPRDKLFAWTPYSYLQIHPQLSSTHGQFESYSLSHGAFSVCMSVCHSLN